MDDYSIKLVKWQIPLMLFFMLMLNLRSLAYNGLTCNQWYACQEFEPNQGHR